MFGTAHLHRHPHRRTHWGHRQRTNISVQRRVGHVHEGIRGDGITFRSRIQKNPSAAFVDRIACYRVATAAAAATTIQVDAILAAAIDDIALHRVPIAAQVDGIEILRPADMVGLDDRAVARSICGVGHRERSQAACFPPCCY